MRHIIVLIGLYSFLLLGLIYTLDQLSETKTNIERAIK